MAQYLHRDAIVTTEWVEHHLTSPGVRVFDCSIGLKDDPSGQKPYLLVPGREDYESGHIPGAAYVDIQRDLSDENSDYLFTMLPLDHLAKAAAGLGISTQGTNVLYSRGNPYWAIRLWWMLRAIGIDNAAILDGGYGKWESEERDVSDKSSRHEPATLTPTQARPEIFVGKSEVLAAIDAPTQHIVSALSNDPYFTGSTKYTRAGRIPGSGNIAGAHLLERDGTLVSAEKALAMVTAANLSSRDRSILYCGGGIAASLVAFVLYQLGFADVAVYDNSLSEWGPDVSLPIELGPNT